MNMNSLSRLVVLLSVLMLAGCATLLAKDLKRNKANWGITINTIYDGSGYSKGNITYVPPIGMRFITVNMSIHNKAKKDRLFKLFAVTLANGKAKVAYGPAILDMDAIISIEANEKPVLSGNETITRNVIFSFPHEHVPDRIIVEEVGVIKLPKSKTAYLQRNTPAG